MDSQISIADFHATQEVADVPAAIRFFEPFGFTADVTMGNPPVFARLRHNHITFTFSAAAAAAISKIVAVYFDVTDLDAVLAVCHAEGTELVQPVTSHPWGMQDIVIRGPEGHLFAFGQRLA